MAKLPEKSIQHQRCFNHANREPVAKCPHCNRFYCRECITEHNRKLVCSKCLEEITSKDEKKSNTMVALCEFLIMLIGFSGVMFILAILGWFLMQIPNDIHTGAKWF